MDKKEAPPQKYLEEIIRLAIETWDGDISEFRVIQTRNGASVLPSTRTHYKFSTTLERKRQ